MHEPFGEHYMFDGYFGDKEKLDSEENIKAAIYTIIDKTGMRPIMDTPVVVNAEANGLKDPGGISAFIMIAESHIGVHTFTGRGFVSVDVYTCKNGMDKDLLTSILKEAFGTQKEEVNMIVRGKHYPVVDLADMPANVKATLDRTDWTYAKTMAAIPHYYIVAESHEMPDFVAVAEYIDKHGLANVFYGKVYKYLYYNGYKYWTMDKPLTNTNLINREKL